MKKGFSDTRGTLFFDIERILLTKKPKAFLLENVKQLKGHDQGRTLKIILEHIELQVKYLGESTGIKEMRKYMSYYLKNMPNATQMRQKINQIETKKELQESIIKYFETYKA